MLTDEMKYQILRDEMMGCVNRQDSYLFTAETIAVALWTIAITESNEFLALLSLIVLLPFAFRIYDLRYAITFLAAYLKVVLENEQLSGWETIHDKYYEETPLKITRKIWNHTAKIIIPMLSLISCALFWFIRIVVHDKPLMTIGNFVIIIIQALLVILQLFIYYKSNSQKMKKQVTDNWRTLKEKYIDGKLNDIKKDDAEC